VEINSSSWQTPTSEGNRMAAIPLPAALSLHGKRVLVTGAASGIGTATALVLIRLGATLLITDRAQLEETRDETGQWAGSVPWRKAT
jgi:NADPH:quinone reductase-like Zn-dependent oxidoreductase